MYVQEAWPDLAEALADGLEGDGTRLAAIIEWLYPRDAEGNLSNIELATAVQCADEAWRPSEAEIRAAAEEIDAGPGIDFAWTWLALTSCTALDAPRAPVEMVKLGGAVPTLVIANTGDPATPYEWGIEMAELFDLAVVLTFEANRHTAGGAGSRCVDDAVTAYVVELQMPQPDTRCPES